MLITRRQLLNQATYSRNIETAQMQIINENRTIFEKQQVDTHDIFLSHSYKDKDLVVPLVELIQNCGYTVYVDWIDDKKLNRLLVNKDTANLLRERMKKCKSLVYLTTENATNSKWCPWELGYYDGFSKNQRCCIIPVVDYDISSFKGQEYLGLYNYIQHSKQKGTDKNDLWVYDTENENQYVRFDLWIKGKNPENH